jgi:hypothetical protein
LIPLEHENPGREPGFSFMPVYPFNGIFLEEGIIVIYFLGGKSQLRGTV